MHATREAIEALLREVGASGLEPLGAAGENFEGGERVRW